MNSIEEKYLPLLKILEDENFLNTIENEYKGFITALNPLIQNPKILFLGINPGSGAYNEINQKKGIDKKFPKTMFSNTSLTQIDWLKDGNARGEFIGNFWKPYTWFDRTSKVNNIFVKRLIEFLFAYYNLLDTSDFKEAQNKINSEIFYCNIYPIATETTKELDFILKKLASKKLILNGNKINNKKDLKNFFRQRTIDLIHNIKPEIIICLGNQAFKDLSFKNGQIDSNNPTKEFKIKLRNSNHQEHSVFIISRNGNWEQRIKKLGKHLSKFNY